MKNLFKLLLLLLSCCGSEHYSGLALTHRYDLAQPIFINMEDKLTQDGKSTFPCMEQFKQGLQNAISLVGGVLSQDPKTPQQITLYNTDGDKCSGKSTFAFTEQPPNGRIAVCHSIAVLNNCYKDVPTFFTDVLLHELGHELGDEFWHIGGDEVPADKCVNHYIMAWNIHCHPGVTKFVGEDLSFLCGKRFTINGVCK